MRVRVEAQNAGASALATTSGRHEASGFEAGDVQVEVEVDDKEVEATTSGRNEGSGFEAGGVQVEIEVDDMEVEATTSGGNGGSGVEVGDVQVEVGDMEVEVRNAGSAATTMIRGSGSSGGEVGHKQFAVEKRTYADLTMRAAHVDEEDIDKTLTAVQGPAYPEGAFQKSDILLRPANWSNEAPADFQRNYPGRSGPSNARARGTDTEIDDTADTALLLLSLGERGQRQAIVYPSLPAPKQRVSGDSLRSRSATAFVQRTIADLGDSRSRLPAVDSLLARWAEYEQTTTTAVGVPFSLMKSSDFTWC